MGNKMMMCSRCGERPAVIYVSQNTADNKPVGYCIKCARELGVGPVDDMLKRMGISDEMIENMENSLMNLSEMDGFDWQSMAQSMQGIVPSEDDDDEEDFTPGGAATFPFMQGEETEKDDKKEKKNKKKKRKNLDLYCTNLTGKAKAGELDRIIGRDKEIERVVQILSRRTKNNPCLIGEPGVGKTAIAEGLAIRIAEGNVPARLKKKEIHLLDLTSLVAGTQFRGQFEARIKGLLEEVKHDGNIILFIDEVHNLVGAGEAEGSMNAANIMKPALSRGEIQVIGATTFTEYRKYIEKDSALERRFQPVTVVEPSIEESYDVLKGIKSYYEEYHRVRVQDSILKRAVVMAERYITDRFLPDKAIDLMDEACACAALRNNDMAEYDNTVDQIERLKYKESQLEGEEAPDYEKLADVRTKLLNLEKKAEELAPMALGTEVTVDDLAHVIELWTGIPESRVQESELKKLSELESVLGSKVIGQDEAVKALAAAIRRSKVQISPRRHPASFIFVGPTGVGKTELVKVLANELFDTPETLIRLDMSEFMEKHSVSRIIGSPPGYVGYDEAGQVTEKVRRRPYSVLLFDEIEKAHPDVMNILLQILDEGRITDAQGRTVNFENTVIVMTSNAGSQNRESALGFNKTNEDASRERAMKGLSEFLRPEFLARVDEIIFFHTLGRDDFVKIAKLMLSEYEEPLNEKGIKLAYTDEVCVWLADHAIGGKSGARDLRNLIRKEVEDKIATEIVNHCDDIITGISITVADDKIKLDVL